MKQTRENIFSVKNIGLSGRVGGRVGTWRPLLKIKTLFFPDPVALSHNLLLAPTDFHSAHAIVLLSIAVRVSLDMTQGSHQTDKPEKIATDIRISSSLCVTAGPACIAFVYVGLVTYSIVFHTGCWHNSCEVHLEKEDENCTD